MEMNTFINFYILSKRIIYNGYNFLSNHFQTGTKCQYTLWSVRVDCFTHAVYESLRGSMNSYFPFPGCADSTVR